MRLAAEAGTIDPIAEAFRQWKRNGWGPAAPGMAAVTTIVRVHQLLMARIEEALDRYDLSFARFEILRLLAFTRHGELPMGKLGSRLQVHPASVTSAVKRLEFDGLVRRMTHPEDNRSTLAVITADGRRLLAPTTAALNQVFEDLGPEPADLNELVRILNGIRAEAGDRIEASARESRV